MSLREVTRTNSRPANEWRDRLIRCVLKKINDTYEIWGEWEIEMADGRLVARSARCDPEAEAEILAIAGLATAVDMVRDNTHDKVLA